MISTVLIVEDERLLARALRSTFVSLGIQVLDTVSTFEEAVSKTNQLHPDMIVMDIQIDGEKNGVEAAEAIRHFSHTPIVFQSNCSEVEWVEKAHKLPRSLFLGKTISKSDWNYAINQFSYSSMPMVA